MKKTRRMSKKFVKEGKPAVIFKLTRDFLSFKKSEIILEQGVSHEKNAVFYRLRYADVGDNGPGRRTGL